MKRVIALSIVVFVSGAVGSRVFSDDKKPDWTEMDKPGEFHKKLEPLVGEFDVDVKFYMPGAAEPAVSKGSMKSHWIHDGRFVESRFESDMAGKKFTGTALIGYDNYAKSYTEVWADSTQTPISVVRGSVDDAGKVFTFTQGLTDAAGKKATQKWVTTVESNDKYVFTLSNTGEDGVEHKVLEDTYTRKK